MKECDNSTVMKTILKILGGVFVLLVVSGVSLYFFLDPNQYKGRLETLIEEKVQGDIALGNIRLSLFPYIGFYLKDISLRHRNNGPEVFSLQEVSFRVHFKSLFSGKIIASLVVDHPIIHTDQFAGLFPEQKETAKQPPFSLEEILQKQPWLGKLLIEEIRIKDGEVWKKEGATLKPFDFALSSIQLSHPENPWALLFDTKQNGAEVALKTNLWVDLLKKSIRIGDGQFHFGDIAITIKGFLGFGKTKPYDITVNAQDIDISKISTVATGKGLFNFVARGEDLNTADLVKSIQGDGLIQLTDGKINSVNLATAVFPESMANLIKTALVLSSGDKEIILPGKQEDGTPYKSITIPFRVENGSLLVENLKVENPDVVGSLNGSIGLTDLALDLTGECLFSKEASAGIVKDQKFREYVLTTEGFLKIPVHITGTIQSPKVTPDEAYVRDLFTNAAKKAYAEQVQQKVLPKVQEEAKKVIPTNITDQAKKIFHL